MVGKLWKDCTRRTHRVGGESPVPHVLSIILCLKLAQFSSCTRSQSLTRLQAPASSTTADGTGPIGLWSGSAQTQSDTDISLGVEIHTRSPRTKMNTPPPQSQRRGSATEKGLGIILLSPMNRHSNTLRRKQETRVLSLRELKGSNCRQG